MGVVRRPRFMTVSEVREVMRRMWAQNSAVLRLLFAQGAALRVLGSPDVQRHVGAHAFEEAYRMFFLQVLPVAPNRVRPVSMMGDQSFEHPHNLALTRVCDLLTSDINLLCLLQSDQLPVLHLAHCTAGKGLGSGRSEHVCAASKTP